MPAKEAKEQAQPKPKRKIPKTAVIIAVISVVEAATFYGLTSFMGAGPDVAHGQEAGDDFTAGEDPSQKVVTAEIALLSGFKVPNDKRGQSYMYDLEVYLKVRDTDQEMLNAFVESHRGEVSDRIAGIVRGADPTMLHEPELKTLRLKIRHMLNELLGDSEVVIEVLIPTCVPMRAG
jgi:flagellar basal body-associated protein FliL